MKFSPELPVENPLWISRPGRGFRPVSKMEGIGLVKEFRTHTREPVRRLTRVVPRKKLHAPEGMEFFCLLTFFKGYKQLSSLGDGAVFLLPNTIVDYKRRNRK